MAKTKATTKNVRAPRRVDEPQEENSGISAVAVEGFKSIRNPTEIAIKPLTILAGANSSGKSSIMQPLLLMKQTLEAPFDPGTFLLDGPNVRFTSAHQVVSKFGLQFPGSVLESVILTTFSATSSLMIIV